MALYDTVLNHEGQPAGIDLVYLVVGTMTRPVVLSLLTLFTQTTAATAQTRLDLNRLYTEPRLTGTAPKSLAWSADGSRLAFLWSADGSDRHGIW